MGKFISLNFLGVVILALLLLVVHEWGHYVAYRVLGYRAKVRKSLIAPGIDPVETIEVPRWKGLVIAFAGFVVSTILVVLPLFLFQYKYYMPLFIGSIAGASVDFTWAFSMLPSKTITIQSR
ncbi:MAG: hypothetical protein K0S41_3790 [Anaerocolumna sp.]|jgi:hypothetical protein|nr:hypothetical protein [Anaerocolumna sp.]